MPQTIGIVGFNDLDMMQVAFPSVTSVRTHRYEIGRQAVAMALAAIAGNEARAAGRRPRLRAASPARAPRAEQRSADAAESGFTPHLVALPLLCGMTGREGSLISIGEPVSWRRLRSPNGREARRRFGCTAAGRRVRRSSAGRRVSTNRNWEEYR